MKGIPYEKEFDRELKSRVRKRNEDSRGEYFRDTTAIIHSCPFRRLKHKTQVFFSPSDDHICTRMEHSLHVASVASSICRALGLDTDLAFAIGIGHDLGHTPFGHEGERVLSEISTEMGYGEFSHELHSLRVVDFLANDGRGLNLTYAVRDGIVCHNGEKVEEMSPMKPTLEVSDLSSIESREGLVAATYEGVVVRFSDVISYIGRDYEDAVRLSVVESEPEKEITDMLGHANSEIIDTLVNDVIKNSEQDEIRFSDGIFDALKSFKNFNTERIYRSSYLVGEKEYIDKLLRGIARYLNRVYDGLACSDFDNPLSKGFTDFLLSMGDAYDERGEDRRRAVTDYIAGMTDNFCMSMAQYLPESEREEIKGLSKLLVRGGD